MLRRTVLQIENSIRSWIASLSRSPVAYATSAPSPQVALDIFEGEWSSALPEPWNVYRAGSLPLYAHEALAWAISEWGGVAGCHVLELGPLEGLHTYVLEQRGAASVTAIEANPRAFLRCLVVKEILGLTRSHFLHGNFLEFLAKPLESRFDVAVASGVLYHMEDPVLLLGHLSSACDRLYMWTHYYDAEHIHRRTDVEARFGAPKPRTTMGFDHVVHPYHYAIECYRGTFCGGVKEYSHWLTRDDILRALRHFGFHDIKVAHDEPAHIHGPAFALIARRAADA